MRQLRLPAAPLEAFGDAVEVLSSSASTWLRRRRTASMRPVISCPSTDFDGGNSCEALTASATSGFVNGRGEEATLDDH